MTGERLLPGTGQRLRPIHEHLPVVVIPQQPAPGALVEKRK